MAEKLDFMSELAKDVEAKKHGQTSTFGSINDFVPTHQPAKETDFDRTQDYEVPVTPQAPSPAAPQPQTESYAPQGEEAAEAGQETGKQGTQSFESLYENNNAQSSDNNSPASFQEEVRVKVDKPKRQLSPAGIGIAAAAIALVGFLVWFFFIRASITLPDFTGKSLSDVSSWAKQNKIENTSIAPSYVFSMEYDNDIVISQTPAGGTKVKTNTPINLVVSKGADPDEEVAFPSDLKSMTYEELTAWKNENKLSKTKITTEYNTAVPAGEVISYELKNTSENDFRRNSTLTIKTSKGPAPAGQVTVENFVNKTFNEAATWANQKKVQIVKQEVNSDTVEANYIISQTPASGQAMAEGDTFTVVVSKGKGVKVPNLVGYTAEQLEAWKSAKSNTLVIVKKSVYDEAPAGSVIAQSVSPGTILDSGDVLLLTISLYMPILETNSRKWIGKDYLELRAWCDDVNSKGVDIQAGEWGEDFQPIYSDEYPEPGQIIKIACYYGTSDLADGCGRPLTANSRINYQRSLGPKTVKNKITLTQENLSSVQSMVNFCDTNKMACVYSPMDMSEGTLVKVKFNGNTYTNKDYFQEVITQGTYIEVYYQDDYSPSKPSAVLATKDLENLSTITSFCNSSGIACRFEVNEWYVPEGEHVIVVVRDRDTGATEEFTYDDKFQYHVESNQEVYVYYRRDTE